MQTFQPNSFISLMLIGTIGFYHFIPRSVNLTISHTLKLKGMKFGVVMKQFMLNYLMLRFTVLKNLNIGMQWNAYDLVCLKLGMMIGITELSILKLVYFDLDLDIMSVLNGFR